MNQNGKAILLEDDGYVLIEIGDVEVRLDVFQVNNRLWEIGKKAQDKPLNDYHVAVVDFMVSLGLPSCSHRLASKFIDTIADQVEALKKKASPSPELPGSTGSIRSNSPGCS